MTNSCRGAIVGLVMTAPLLAARPAINNDAKTAAHVLNRVAFGLRPGDVEKIRTIGIDRYIDEQLHPERIPDSALAPRLAGLASITMSSREIAEKYEQPLMEARRQRAANGRQNGQP